MKINEIKLKMKLTKEEKMLAELGDKFFLEVDRCIKVLENIKKFKKEFKTFTFKSDTIFGDKQCDKKYLKSMKKLEKIIYYKLKKLENGKPKKNKKTNRK